MKVSLKKFLQTGALGQVQLGVSLHEIAPLLGSAMTGESGSHDGQSKMCILGDLHIGFQQDSAQTMRCSSLLWLPSKEGLHVPSDWGVEDWELTASVKPDEMKRYLRKEGIQYQFRSSKNYYVRKYPNARTSPEMAEAARTLGFLSFRKPKNEADILRTCITVTLYLPSGGIAFFEDEKLVHVMLNETTISFST